MNYLPFLFFPFFFFFDTSINEHPIAYVRSIKKSMKPAFFLNLIPDFFSLFFNKNSSRYIYIYLFTLDSRFISTSPLRHYLLSRGHNDYSLDRTEFPRNEGQGGREGNNFSITRRPKVPISGKVDSFRLIFRPNSASAVNGARQLPRISLLIIAVTVIQTVGAFYASLWIYEDSRKEGASWTYQFVTGRAPAIFSTRFSHTYLSPRVRN